MPKEILEYESRVQNLIAKSEMNSQAVFLVNLTGHRLGIS
jgi:hypothetical protein